jgi:hypothetical protein
MSGRRTSRATSYLFRAPLHKREKELVDHVSTITLPRVQQLLARFGNALHNIAFNGLGNHYLFAELNIGGEEEAWVVLRLREIANTCNLIIQLDQRIVYANNANNISMVKECLDQMLYQKSIYQRQVQDMRQFTATVEQVERDFTAWQNLAPFHHHHHQEIAPMNMNDDDVIVIEDDTEDDDDDTDDDTEDDDDDDTDDDDTDDDDDDDDDENDINNRIRHREDDDDEDQPPRQRVRRV